MVQGLAFLSKKSWHVKNIANQERVWMEEQKKAAEELKTKELAKQIQQELEEEELDRIAGRKSSNRLDRGIDWMYQGVKSEASKEDAEKEAEAYLLGKKFTRSGEAKNIQGDLDQDNNENQGLLAVVTSSEAVGKKNSSAAFVDTEPSVKDRNEAFRVRHEDPMFLVSQRRREEEEKVGKTKALFERVVGPITEGKDEEKRQRKKRKKDEKRKRKERRKEERRSKRYQRKRDYSSSHSENDYGSDASNKDDSIRKTSSKRHRRYIDSPKRTNGAGYRHCQSRDAYYDDGGDKYHRRSSNRHNSYIYGRPKDDDYVDDDNRHHMPPSIRGQSRDDHYYHNDDKYHRRLPERYNCSNSSVNKLNGKYFDSGVFDTNIGYKYQSSKTYGLQGSQKRKLMTSDDLGPNNKLLEERRREKEANRRRYQKASRITRTEEERKMAIEAMKTDASCKDKMRNIIESGDIDEKERKSAIFLHQMAQQTHGINRDHNSTMAMRVAQNRSRNQISIDDSFI